VDAGIVWLLAFVEILFPGMRRKTHLVLVSQDLTDASVHMNHRLATRMFYGN
jgi:hypothetical protein